MNSDNSYITIDTLRRYAYQYNEEDLKFFEDVIPRASRLFDKLCGVKAGYFTERSEAAETRVFYGKGSQLLALPNYFGPLPTVTMPDGYTVPNFIVRGEYLLTTDANGLLQTDVRIAYPVVWPATVPISVTAFWGFDQIPDDVVEGVAELVIAIWRSKDTAFLKAINMETMQVTAEAVPKRVMLIAQSYQHNSLMPAFA